MFDLGAPCPSGLQLTKTVGREARQSRQTSGDYLSRGTLLGASRGSSGWGDSRRTLRGTPAASLASSAVVNGRLDSSQSNPGRDFHAPAHPGSIAIGDGRGAGLRGQRRNASVCSWLGGRGEHSPGWIGSSQGARTHRHSTN